QPEASQSAHTFGTCEEQARSAPGWVNAISPSCEMLSLFTTCSRIVARSTDPFGGMVMPFAFRSIVTAFGPAAEHELTCAALSTQPLGPTGTNASFPETWLLQSGSVHASLTVIGPVSCAGTGATPSAGATIAGVSVLVLLAVTTTSISSPTGRIPQFVGKRESEPPACTACARPGIARTRARTRSGGR